MQTKSCTRCFESKPLSGFYRDDRLASGLRAHCKQCMNVRNKEYRQNNVESLMESTRSYRLSRYGMTVEDFDALLQGQGGVCAICGRSDPGRNTSWNIDHDHGCCDRVGSCGDCIRGLLCVVCNTRLGWKEDSAWNERADSYLLRKASSCA